MQNFLKKYITHNYFVRRLLPFYIAAIMVELVTVFIIAAAEYHKIDWSIWAIVKTLTVLVWHVSVSFVYIAIPLMIYLISIKPSKQYKKFDKVFTFLLFFIFLTVMIFEDVSEMVFWEEFESTFNFIAIDYLIYTKEVIGNVFQSYPVIPMLAGVLLVSFAFSYTFRKSLYPQVKAPVLKHRFLAFAVLIVMGIGAYFAADIKDAEVTDNRYNNELAKDGMFSLFSAFLNNELNYNDFYITRSPYDNLTFLKKTLNNKLTKFTNKENSIERVVKNSAKEKHLNVIVVVMESMGMEFFKESGLYDRELVPNLQKFANEGIFFSKTYATGTRSIRGLEAISVSIPPLPGMSIVRRKGNDHLQTIGSIFKEKGYTTKWIYGGYGYFDNMNEFYRGNGFEVVDRNNIDDREITHATIWGVADEDLFKKAIYEADHDYASKKPFLQVVFTTSNHRPYTYPEGRIDIPSKTGREGAVKYADYAVGELIREASKKRWFDDTVFVFVADHGAKTAGKKELNPDRHLIPFIIYSPKNIKPKKYNFAISQIDVLPTLLGVLGFNYKADFYGKDARLPGYESRYFISNYQLIGYAKDDKMVVMKPVKAVSYYEGENMVKGNGFENMLEEAIAYYQHAFDWRKHLKID